MNAEEKRNKTLIQDLISGIMNLSELKYNIISCGGNVEIMCHDIDTLSILDEYFQSLCVENQFDSIRGTVSVRFSHAIKY